MNEPTQRIVLSPFVVGDVVRLRSGGPRMTVVKLTLSKDTVPKQNSVGCRWIDQAGQMHQGDFDPRALRRVIFRKKTKKKG